ncbi:fibronectin type III domain-containing protein [Aquimarina sediminis]|uniref:fibronectin type III domain-containing protein n=1 Tax=Aquimarina sediminis TaxID=2070536 RepID=UPI000CA07DA5|nr:fibronectin type III domain-containing protein [Aquimarina sediminis]
MKKLIFTLFIILYSSSQAIAQRFPVIVVPQVNAPAPVNFFNYADATTINSPLRVQLLLNDITITNEQIRLKVHFEGNGIAFQSRDVVVGAPSLFIDGGTPRVLTNVELAPYFELQNIEGISSNIYGRTIPEGSYQFCFEVFDFSTGNRFSSKTCTSVYIFKNEPPILNLPLKGVNIEPTEIENIVFQWTPRHINVSNVEYKLSIVEIWDDTVDPQTAFLSLPPIFETTTRSTSFVYGPSQPLLLPEKRYAWQVQAKALQGAEEIGLFRNEGKSEVFWFSRTSPCDVPLNVYAEPKGISKINVFWDEDPSVYHEYTIAYREANKPNAYWFTMRTNSGWATIWNLKPGTTYEYKVKGKCKYQYGPYSDVQEVTTETAQDVTANYNCGIVPDAMAITNREPHPGLQVGSRITAGDFMVTVVEIESQSNGRITGRGYVGIPYLRFTHFGVKFDNILINTDSQLAEGEIVTLYDPEYGEGETMTVDLNTDIAEIISGDEGETSQVQVGFQIESITVDEHGAIIITGTNGEEALISGGRDIEIVDSNGKVWTVNEQGGVQDYGEIAEEGASTDGNTEGITGDDIIQISATDVLVTFKKSGYYYYDELPEGTEDVLGKESLYPSIPKKEGGIYRPPFKAISNLNGNDIILAEADFKDSSVTTEDIIFKTKSGVLIPATWNGNVATLTLKKSFDYAKTKVLATVKPKEEGGKHTIAGVLNLIHLGSQEFSDINIVLIPVNNATISRTVETRIKEIYSKVGVNFNIEIGERLQIPNSVWDLEEPYNEINAGDSGVLAEYSPEEAAINTYFKANSNHKDEAYYIFVTDIKGVNSVTKEELGGFMPLKSQFGYIFQGAKDDAVTAAHELGHGVFGLKHPFSEYGTSEKATDFLMDYNDGSIFNHMDWENIYAPGFKLYWFQGDEDGESVTISSYFKDTGILKDIGADTYTFITPSAELIILPEDVADVEFYYGYYGESVQGDFRQFMNFTPGTLKSFKIGDKKYEARIQFLDDDSADLLGYYSIGDNPVKFNNTEYKTDSWSNTTPTIMSYDGRDFVLARLWNSYATPLPTYDSTTNNRLKRASEFPAPKSGGIVFSEKLPNYTSLGSNENIVSSEIAKWALGSYSENIDRPDIFIRNKIAELKAAFPVQVDYITSDFFDKWKENDVCNLSAYPEARTYKFIRYLSDEYCDCTLITLGEELEEYYSCSDKPGKQKPDNKIQFLREYISFLEDTVDKEMESTLDVIAKIRDNADFVDTINVEILVKSLNFATTADIQGLESIHIIRILSKMAHEGIFERSDISKNREGAILRLIENVDPKIASEVILGLEARNSYDTDEYLYKQIFTQVDDKIFGFISGDNNRVRLIQAFAVLALNATGIHEERMKAMVDNIDERAFILEYQNVIKRAAIGFIDSQPFNMLKYTEMFQEWSEAYYDIDVDYDSDQGTFVGVQQKKRGLSFPEEIFQTKESLKPFDFVYFINKSNIDVVKEADKKIASSIMPAIVLMFADVSAENQTIATGIIATFDAVSLVSGVGTLASTANGIRKAVAVLDIGADMASLGVTALSDTDIIDPKTAQEIGNTTLIYSVLRLGIDGIIRFGNNGSAKLSDVYSEIDNSPTPPPVGGVLDELDNLPIEKKMILANDDAADRFLIYYLRRARSQAESGGIKNRITKHIDELEQLRWRDKLPDELKADLAKSKELETLFENASIIQRENYIKTWEVLQDFTTLRTKPENIEILTRISSRFEYQNATSFDGLRKLLAEGSPASKKKLINGLDKVDKIFDSGWPVTFSGIKKGEVKVISAVDGTKAEIARVVDDKIVKNKFLNETDGAKVVGNYEGVDILKKGDVEIGFRPSSVEDMLARLKQFPDLQKNFEELDDILKPQFVEDFANVTDDVLKKIKDEDLFDAWKNNVRSTDLEVLRNSISKSNLRNEYDGLVTGLANEKTRLLSEGKTIEEVANIVFERRRSLTIEYKHITPDDFLEWIFKRNDITYTQTGKGDKWGATFDGLFNSIANKKGIDVNTATPAQLDEIYEAIANGASKTSGATKHQLGDNFYNFFENAKNQGKVSAEEFDAFVQILYKYRMK